jgi:hypothetical protein
VGHADRDDRDALSQLDLCARLQFFQDELAQLARPV